MSDNLDILLADQRRIEDRPMPAHPRLTRADQIIHEGDVRRMAYRKLNPSADAAMVYGAQIGYLHGEIRRLDGELQSYTPTRDTNLSYVAVYCDELDCDVLVGYDYSAGEDSQTSGPPENCYEGAPETMEVCEVWLNGADIAAVLLERVAEQLSDAALAHEHQSQEDAMVDFHERGRDFA